MAQTPNIVELFVCIDAEDIIKQYGRGGTLDHPTQIAHQDRRIFMVGSHDDVISGFGASELNVKMRTNQQLQISSMSLQPIEYTMLLRRCTLLAGGNLVSPPRCAAIQKNTMVMDPNKRPPEANVMAATTYFYRWSMDAEQAGRVTYNFTFQIWDNTSPPTDLGCFIWDPFITISL